ncbi:hypothetical protein RGR602_PB00151 (plasmid) [Rhizobium gallicum bv. gallicum R602sp]|uniref:Uncharacterized protein n=1 Tax=Rhizobium gallicum bv. gallicum R602sp TaxID=1041138 RepID=A0A0B4X6H5_9HYPH|nr:hypothetical protein RGR602_PB00151 [Rhizobium gallicum bv. gallicum R602sp]
MSYIGQCQATFTRCTSVRQKWTAVHSDDTDLRHPLLGLSMQVYGIYLLRTSFVHNPPTV